jgi:hypothetical protein
MKNQLLHKEMKIIKKFNLFSKSEYKYHIENHKKFIDFNTLGLYQSILENEKLNLADKIVVRDFANRFFQKIFEFLQVKDPFTYFELITLGETLTKGDERQIWKQIIINQEKILKSKKIKHRNFGIYSKHNCGYETCNFNGLMTEQGSYFTEHEMRFDSDKNRYSAKLKSQRFKKERRKEKETIKIILESEETTF